MTQTTTQEQRLDFLIRCLLNEKEEYRDIEVPADKREKQRLLRSLMNVRPPVPASDEFLKVQDAYLQERLEERGVTKLEDLTPVQPGLYLWQGDITTLAVDAIVNAANSQMLGCFVPCHGCIDNAIHSAAGIELREECSQYMDRRRAQYGKDYEEPTGQAVLTAGYNLPAEHVIHTVGPIVYGKLTEDLKGDLRNCYKNILKCCVEHGIRSVAFCCISTGEFHFPNNEAARIAVEEVRKFLEKLEENFDRILFNVFKDVDRALYRELV